MCRILTGIVTYNPDIDRLKQNLETIMDQTDELLIIDNASENFSQIKTLAAGKFIELEKNHGIAYALRRLMNFANKNGYDWVLTLDQDSVADRHLVEEYRKYMSDYIGAMTCLIRDRNYPEIEYENRGTEVADIDWCITSGCLMNVKAYGNTSGYDTKMFIDCVDIDICYSLKEAGYRVIRIPYEGLLHEIGKAKRLKVLGRKTQTFNHPAWRRYYVNRNTVYLAKKHPEYGSVADAVGRCIYHTFITLIYEDDRMNKLKANIRGIRDGIRGKMS